MKKLLLCILAILGVCNLYAQKPSDFIEDAKKGNNIAQYNLGVCYHKGYGTEKNAIEAAKWFIKSAESGLPQACFWAGFCYYDGIGVDVNYEEAVRLFQQVISNPTADKYFIAEAQGFLAQCFANGQGVLKDPIIAARLWEKSAEYGNMISQLKIGLCYEMGLGVPNSDFEKACYWYRKAAQQGEENAQRKLKSFNKTW